MPFCPGKKKNGSKCMNQLYRCKKCGNVGCDRPSDGECSNQGFKVGKCLKCGATGQKENF